MNIKSFSLPLNQNSFSLDDSDRHQTPTLDKNCETRD